MCTAVVLHGNRTVYLNTVFPIFNSAESLVSNLESARVRCSQYGCRDVCVFSELTVCV